MAEPAKAAASAPKDAAKAAPADKTAKADKQASQKAFEDATQKAITKASETQPQAAQPQAAQAQGGEVQMADFAESRPNPEQAAQGLLPAKEPPKGDPKLDKVVDGVAKGKSLDMSSKDAGFKDGDEGYKAFQDNKAYKATQEGPAGESRKTSITAPDGRTVTENYDFAKDQYNTTVTQPGGPTVQNPTRDGLGWKVSSNLDPKTGAVTTRRENDFGGGEVQESTRLKNGVKVDVATDAKGVSHSEITSQNGTRTSVDGKFDPGKVDAKATLDNAKTKGTGLTNTEIAGLQVAGYDVRTNAGSTSSTTTIGDPKSGQTVLTATSDHESGEQSVSFTDDKGSAVSRTQKADGAVVERTKNTHGTEYVRTKSGAGETLTINGENVDPAKTSANGTAKVTMPDGKAGVILPTGQKVALGANQDGSGDYGGFIEKSLGQGKSIDLISQKLGWTKEQTAAELYLSGVDDVTMKDGKPADFGLNDPSLPADAKVSLTSVTRDGITLSSLTRPARDGKPFGYEVKKGDNLTKIAEGNGLTVDQLLANPENAKAVGANPDVVKPGQVLTIEGGTKTTAGYSFAKDDIGVAGPTMAPVADGGEMTLAARPGETPESIAAEFPWMTGKDVLAANPQLKGGKFKGGESIVIPDSARLAAIKNQNATRDQLDDADVKALVQNEGQSYAAQAADGEVVTPGAVTLVNGMTDEMLYATRRSAAPGGAVDGLSAEMKARRPGDKAWAAAVDIAAQKANSTFAAQGRTDAVMGPLYDLAKSGDPAKFKEHVKNVYSAAAAANPTPEAVQAAKQSLKTYGPQDAGAQGLIDDATQDFLVNDPKAKAAEVQKAYDDAGGTTADRSAAGAKKLAELTNPKTTDPLSAGLILKNAKPTTDKIADDLKGFSGSAMNELQMNGGAYGGAQAGAASNAFRDLGAAADSAARSPDGQAAVDDIASKLKDTNFFDPITGDPIGGSPINKGGVSLSLSMAKQLRADGKPERASALEADVLKSINEKEKALSGLGDELGQIAAPILLPEGEWGPFFSKDQLPKDWSKDQQRFKDIDAKLGQIDDAARSLELAYQAVGRSDLTGSPSQQDLLAKGDPTKMDPKLRALTNTSVGAQVERLRLLNQAGLQGKGLGETTVVPDASWSTRMARNTIQNTIALKTGTRPSNFGLSLFGLGTYARGFENKTAQGGQSYVTAGLYAWGGATEAYGALGNLLKNTPWARGGSEWQKLITGQQGGSPGFTKGINNAPLRALGWWNGISAVQSLAQGDLVPAILHGAAAGGIFTATEPFKPKPAIPGAPEAVTNAAKVAKVAGNWVTALASTGLWIHDEWELQGQYDQLAQSQKDFLTAANIRPEIADLLKVSPEVAFGLPKSVDSPLERGPSAAGALQKIAEDHGTTPQELLQYLNKQTPENVKGLLYRAALTQYDYMAVDQYIDSQMPDFPGR